MQSDAEQSYLNNVATNGQGLIRLLRIVAEPAVRRGVEHADADVDVGTYCKPFNDVATQPLRGAHRLAKLRLMVSDADEGVAHQRWLSKRNAPSPHQAE
jgi:hypothetical protein